MNTTQKERGWMKSSLSGLMALMVVSCGSGVPTRPSAGAALIDTDAGKEHRSRMKGSRVISVNGVGEAGREAHVAAGLTTARVRYNWPQGGAQEVDLKFKAVPDRRYFVKYAAFPPTVSQLRGTTMLSTTAEGIADSSYEIMASGAHLGPGGFEVATAAGLAVLSPAVVLGTVDYFHRVGQDIREGRKAAQWVDMMVISEVDSEGVVRFVRVYPTGKVEWKPWDAASNAPGHAQRGRALNSRPGEAANGPKERADNTFQRRKGTAE